MKSQTIADRGKASVAFGRALQDDQTGLRELVDLAAACGLTITIRIDPVDAPTVPQEDAERGADG